LAALADRPPDQVTGVLDELLRSRALIEDEQGGEIRFDFVHSLVRETAYQTLGATRRRALHRMVGRALRQSGQLAEAAPHFARSAVVGDDEAIDALLEGIRRAEEREAYRESLTLLSGLVDVLPSGDERWLQAADALAWQADWVNDRGRGDKFALAALGAMREIDAVLESSPDLRRRAAVKLRLATFLIYSAGQIEEGVRLAAVAEELYRAVGDGNGAGLACMNQGAGHILEGRLAFAIRYFEELLSTPEVAADEALATRVRAGLGLAMFYAGSFDIDEENLQRNLADAQARNQDYLEILFLSGLATSWAYQGRTAEARSTVQRAKTTGSAWRDAPVLEFEVQALWLEGDLTTALERADEILEWNPEGLTRRRATGFGHAAMAAMELGRLESARRYIDLAVPAFDGRVYAHWLDILLHADGVVLAREGRPEAGIETLEATSSRMTDNGFRPSAVFALADLADVAVTIGDAELAARAARSAAEAAAGIDRDCYRGLALLAGTSAALAAGLDDEAAQHARDAVKVLSRTGWRLYQARALYGLGMALRNSDSAGGRDAFDEAIALFEACGAVWRRERALEARP
jgi:tetratricopeptide (TPR) repeat protein